MKIWIHLVHPLGKLLGSKEVKYQECGQSEGVYRGGFDGNILTHCVSETHWRAQWTTSDFPRTFALQLEIIDQNKKIITGHQACWELWDASAMGLAPAWLGTWSPTSTEPVLIGIRGCIHPQGNTLVTWPQLWAKYSQNWPYNHKKSILTNIHCVKHNGNICMPIFIMVLVTTAEIWNKPMELPMVG